VELTVLLGSAAATTRTAVAEVGEGGGIGAATRIMSKIPSNEEDFSKRLDSTSTDLAPGKRYVVGAAIFRKGTHGPSSPPSPQLLVLKRAPTETSFPNLWEIPCGHVDAGETVRQALARETREETALKVDGVVGELEEMH
jgi:hypothetical protein